MSSRLVEIIAATEPALRNQSLEAVCAKLPLQDLVEECAELDGFRRRNENLYQRVRALFFLYALHRFHLPAKLAAADAGWRTDDADSTEGRSVRLAAANKGLIPFKGYEHLLRRRFEEAIEHFLSVQKSEGPSDGISSALAAAYHRLAFQTLADQVRRSVRSVRGNQWMFRMGHPLDQPLRIRPELLRRGDADGSYPLLRERTPVRMDLTHCGWSDIFFLAMDYPEGAKVLNVSIDLAVHGRDPSPKPPVEAYLRVIEEPILRLASVDLGATTDITHLADVFDFAKDYLGLLKAAVIAGGIVPPGVEGSGQSLAELLGLIVGPGRGLELVSSVNNIPKGSRLAVSTNLLAALISVCMRATGQAASLTGPLQEHERRLVLARAILGEWLGGSGGGWQDSGGVWPGMKLITGMLAGESDPEFGVSRGRLMPQHRILDQADASAETRRQLQASLVLVHGGMAQNVGPILEMVTEKYLLRSPAEWRGRQEALGVLDQILAALKQDDIRAVGAATTRNFLQPIQTIIPWASTFYTETLIERVRAAFGQDFWGFWMLGGMSGGGMGFIFAPEKKAAAQQRLQEIMAATKCELQYALPFAMEPVVYDFSINENGTFADLLEGADALMPQGYYALTVPALLRRELRALSSLRRAELDKFGAACRTRPELGGMVQTLFDALLPRGKAEITSGQSLAVLLEQHGFDRTQHEQIRADLKEGRIGLAQNRLPASAVIEDVRPEDVIDATALVAQASSLCGSAGFQPAQAPPFAPFDKQRGASTHSRNLPHWRQEGATYFVTFRLVDSLPREALAVLRREREEWLRRYPGELDSERKAELSEFLWQWQEQYVDQGHGECWLAQPEVADLVEGVLQHFDGERYLLGAYSIMPNHVHALVRPLMGHELSAILHSWKSFSATRANRHLKRRGEFWQEESFDHIVRDERALEKYERYIRDNPEKAKLAVNRYRLGSGKATGTEGSAVFADTPSEGNVTRLSAAGADRGRQDACLTITGRMPVLQNLGLDALRNGQVAVVTLAAGAGSRWTQGAGVVKALHPFCKLGGRHRTFLETHLAKSRRVSRLTGISLPHIFTTSYLTHQPTAEFLARQDNYGYEGPLLLSPGKSVGLRMIPTVRDLRFAWEEMPQQLLDEQQQKVRDSLRAALINWAREAGEATDYTDNLPLQCLHPVGHWYEIPNLFRNGVLGGLLAERPQLKYLLLHNIDTLGADVDPALLGLHIQSGACLTFEVVSRRIDDRGGGLARVNGRVRLVEGLAIPREEAEFGLSYYNSMTTWIDLDRLLAVFELSRGDLVSCGAGVPPADRASDPQTSLVSVVHPGEASADAAGTPAPPLTSTEEKITAAIRGLAAKMPTYITLKEVKKRWGHGQEDIFPVIQFEKLWGDMSALAEIGSKFVVVPRLRGQQLKDQAQLDGWLRDGSAAHVESLCEWR